MPAEKSADLAIARPEELRRVCPSVPVPPLDEIP